MGSLPLHPAVVHVPLGLAFIMPLLALAVLVLFRGGPLPRRPWSLVVGLQAVLMLAALVAQRTGGQEEDRVEAVVAEGAIAAHEEAAERFVWGAAAALVLAAGVLAVPARAARAGALAATLAMAGVTSLGVVVGHAGGRLVYQENAGSAYTAPARGAESGQQERRGAAAPERERS